jgi:hypothetical protein
MYPCHCVLGRKRRHAQRDVASEANQDQALPGITETAPLCASAVLYDVTNVLCFVYHTVL